MDQDEAAGGTTEDFSVKAATKVNAVENFREGELEVLVLLADLG